MASVAIVFRKDKLNSDDFAPIHFRIIKNRKVNYIASTLMIHKDHWDTKKSKVKKGVKNSARMNAFLAHKSAELQDKVLELETMKKGLTTRQLKQHIYGMDPLDFFSFAEKACETYLRAGQIGTYDKSNSIIKKLKAFTENKDIFFQDITPDFLYKYEAYCIKTWTNKVNTIHKDMKFIRKLFNDAYRLGKIEHSHIPFNKYQMKTEKTHRTFLTADELALFEKFAVTPGTRMALHKDMFIFASYAGGLRVSDVLKLKWENFDGIHVSISIHKTKTQLSVLLPKKALEIIGKYKPEEVNPSHFIFPQLENDLKLTDPIAVDTEISRATAYINKNIKSIGEKAKITKHISFHISRHTWATQALQKGISIDKVSKLMGHADISETQIYAKIVNEELDKAMQAFDN